MRLRRLGEEPRGRPTSRPDPPGTTLLPAAAIPEWPLPAAIAGKRPGGWAGKHPAGFWGDLVAFLWCHNNEDDNKENNNN